MRRGFVLQPSHALHRGRPVVQLFGRLESGESFLVEDEGFRPYFFVPAAHAERAAGPHVLDVAATSLQELAGGPVARVTVDVPAAVPVVRERVERAGGRALEADVRFPYRYMIDHGVGVAVAIEGEPRRLREGLLQFASPRLEPTSFRPELRLLSIDLETSPDASRIYSIALLGSDADEVHLVHEHPVRGAVVHRDQRELLAAAAARVRELDPDVITGWNVVDFDLRTWARRAASLRVAMDLGTLPGAPRFQRDRGFTRQSRATLPGRVVLDAIPLVRDAVRLEDYRLETAARSLLGRGKLIDLEGPDAAAEITRLYWEDPEALVAYNREDARLVLDILEKEGLLELTVERSLLSGMQLDRVGASIASFDLLYLPELRRRGRVAPSVGSRPPSAAAAAGVRGGALLEPEPGFFRNVAVFDFKSLYPSLIRSFHLDPLAHAEAGPGDIEAPNGARFSRSQAILPGVIERFMERRAEARRRGRPHADQAIKIMMNALFGVLGAGSCRFFDPAVANAITSFGQQTLFRTRDAFEALGVRVVYGDTDSVFALLPEDECDPRGAAEQLRERVQHRVCEDLRREHGVEPLLELELERVYERFFLPRGRGGKGGTKKRYAGWLEGRLELVGLEGIRRDWPAVARRLQRGMLERAFRDDDAVAFARNVVARVRAGELDDELVYVKRVRKGSLERYDATTPPHVQAARKAGGRVGPVVRYVITAGQGPMPVVPGRPLPEGIDHAHYVERVLRPLAEAILAPLGSSFDEVLGQPRQLPLL